MKSFENTPASSVPRQEKPRHNLPFAALIASIALQACQPAETFAHDPNLDNFTTIELGKARSTVTNQTLRLNRADYSNIYTRGINTLQDAPLPKGSFDNHPPQLDIRYYLDSATLNDPDHPNQITPSPEQRTTLTALYANSFHVDYFTGQLSTESLTNHAAREREVNQTTPDADDILVHQRIDSVRIGYRSVDPIHFRTLGHAEHAEVAPSEDMSIARGIIRLATDEPSRENIGTVRGVFSNYSPAPIDILPVDISGTRDDARYMNLYSTQGRATLAHVRIGQVEHLPNGGVRVTVSGDYGIEE